MSESNAIDDLIKVIVENYSLNTSISCELIRAGDNDNYLIRSGDTKYVLRVYRREKYWLKNDSDYFFEMTWLNFLHQHDCAVAPPVQRKDGEYIGHLPPSLESRHFALFHFAEGEEGPITSYRAYVLGQAIAKVHKISNQFECDHQRLKLDLAFLIDEPVELMAQQLSDRFGNEINQLKKLAIRTKQNIQSLTLSGDSWGIIGGDFHGFNQHFTNDDKVTLFDFDLCGYGYRAYDLAVFRWLQVSDDDIAKTYWHALFKGKLGLWIHFLSGYQTIRSISPEEMSAIYEFVRVRQIWLMGSYIASPNPFIPSDDAWWQKNFARLFKKFQ